MTSTSRRTITLAAIAGALCSTPLTAQTFPTDDPVIRRLWTEGMEQSQVYTLAQTLLDSIGPRLTGSPGHQAAVDWAMSMYARWGIPAEKEQYGTWMSWDRGYTHVDLVEPRKRSLEGTILAWSPGTDGPVEGDVVIMPPPASESSMNMWLSGAAGKFVMYQLPEPTCRPDQNWEALATEESFESMAQARAAARRDWFQQFGRIFRSLPAKLDSAGVAGVITTNWSRGWGVNKIFSAGTRRAPTLDLSCEDYGLLYRLADNDQSPRMRLDAQSEFLGELPVYNVIGRLEGTELPDEYVVLSAHFDSWDGASGATDNGTGSVMMMEAMRILKLAYPNPKRTIIVGHWGGEEQGLIGSRAFTEDHPEVLEGLQAAFNQDNGTWRVEYIRMQGFSGAGASFGRWFGKLPVDIKQHIELDIPGVPERGGSDHMSFICAGTPGFRLQSNYPDYRQYTWHTNRDTFDKLIIDDLKNNATLAAMLAYLASEDPNRVARDKRVMPIDPESGEQTTWPECRPARRASGM